MPLPTSSQKRSLLTCFLLATATLALYSAAICHPFIDEWDDGCYVNNNLNVQQGLSWKTVSWALKSDSCGNWHPLTWLSHGLDCQLFALEPYGHHLTNVLLHVLNVLLLFLLLERATGAVGRSVLVASLFAVHPLNVESVAWVAERKNVLSTLLFLLALGAYGWYARKPSLRRYGILVALFGLGLAAKPMLVTLPCVLLLLDYWPLGRIRGWSPSPAVQKAADDNDRRDLTPFPAASISVTQAPLLRLFLEKVPLFALSAASSLITVVVQRSHNFVREGIPRSERFANAVYSYAVYVWKAFLPTRLAAFYPHPFETLAGWQLGLAGLFLLAVSAWVVRRCRLQPYLVTGWLWFLITLLPVIGIIQVGWQAMADRYTYIPLIGVFVMVIWTAADWAERKRFSFAMRALPSAAMLFVLALITYRQIPYWRSSYDLWFHALQVTKDNPVAEEFFGATLLSSGRSTEAVPHLQKAARIRFLSATTHLKLARALTVTGRSPEAIVEYETAIPLMIDRNQRALVCEALGWLYIKYGNYSKAQANFQEALEINPKELPARDALEKIESVQLSTALCARGEASPALGNRKSP